ncbi:tripartite tricarboxylate transporter substrate binding protein [Pelorhabdus rhamnosifermentans]|uniref:tripartite tricarboxylate transporter substrate binding protein n=1 Tax=Pelorhabdus rhamnosifermentans TaxID=2772457 RepID=UPI001C060DD3|nr:tripartite tricarboxylate transporter substrate binding protein [Pelorhabdus rhamnosifermentans]
MQSLTVITPKIETYPNKPITVIVPYSIGGTGDILARMLEKSSLKYLGQTLTVINKPGGTGTLGWNELTKSDPDGYTIGMASGELLLNPLYGSTKYNYKTSLDPLAQITSIPMLLAIQANQPWRNMNELIQYAKQNPGKLKFSHVGIGSLNHIAGQAFAQSAGIKIEQVPFLGGADAVTALLGGHVQIAIIGPSLAKEYVKSGTIRVLATATDQRLTDPVFANVPTFKEQGLNIVFSNWWAIAAPKDLPVEIKAKLSKSLENMISDPEFKKGLENIGLQYEYLGPEESQAHWLNDSQELTKSVQETGIVDLIKAQKQ